MTDDFLPSAKIDVLRQRAGVLRQIRQFFDERNFFEVETPLLSHDVVVDRYLYPVGISKKDVTGSSEDSCQTLWLQTSPEFGMKRIIAAGAPAIYQICKSFRQSETGAMHNPEFTMLEWYRIGDDMQTGMDLLADLVQTVLERPRTERMSYRDVFRKFAQVDVVNCPVSELMSAANKAGLSIQMRCDEGSRDGWLNLIMSRLIEPQLGNGAPMMIYDWPASQSALAIVRDGQPPVAERFELYVDGIELANGYHELLDADELSKRNSIINQQRVKDGSPLLPEESRLLEAMRFGLPGCAGVALGVDRLMMLATRSTAIGDVIAFPIDRA